MDYLIYGFPAVAIVIALVKLIRQVGIDAKWCPLISVGLGIACGFVMYLHPPYTQAVVVGVVIGLSACGLYDVGKVPSIPVKPEEPKV